jgi:hypothetical protein
LFYQLLLRRLTFYAMNRWYLMGYVVLSFLLPVVHIAFPEEQEMGGKMQVIRYIPNFTGLSGVPSSGRSGEGFTVWSFSLAIVALGALVLTVQLLIRYLSLRRIRKGAVLIRDSGVSIYHVDKPIIPFSFGKSIFINARQHSEKECEEIILHEYVHVRQRHSVDILVGEILCVVTWFNPFSWLIRHSIRQNLEFIADRQVLASGLDRKAYQYHLLKVVGVPGYRLANNFNFSSLRKRIIMMNKSRSARLHLLKFLFIVPLLGVLLVAFRDKVEISLPAVLFHEAASRTPEKQVQSIRTIDSDTLGRPRKDTLKDGKKIKYETSEPSPGTGRDSLPAPMRDTLMTPLHDTTHRQDLGLAEASAIKAAKEVADTSPYHMLREELFIVDGKPWSYEEVKKIDPNKIETMTVLKNKSAEAIYGPKAKNGVVLFTLRTGTGKKQTLTFVNEKDETIQMKADTIRMGN